jgi:predicted lipoprotein with Yx(FWY)xxD motif
MRKLLVTALAAAAVTILGLSAPAGATDRGAKKPPATVKVAKTPLGKVLVGANGRTLYVFDRDTPAASACTTSCLVTWPPALVTGQPVAGSGASASMLGTVSGPGGTQLTYGGKRLYSYAGDRKAAQTKGQGIDGTWWTLGADGAKVTKGAPSGSKPSSGNNSGSGSGDSGYGY